MEKIVIRKKDFVRQLSAETGYAQQDVMNVLNAVDTVAANMLREATSNAEANETVELKLCQGITLLAKWYNSRTGKNPLGGEYKVPARYMLKARFSSGLTDVFEK